MNDFLGLVVYSFCFGIIAEVCNYIWTPSEYHDLVLLGIIGAVVVFLLLGLVLSSVDASREKKIEKERMNAEFKLFLQEKYGKN